VSKVTRHPLDGAYNYFDSELHMTVKGPSTYKLHGKTYKGRFAFEGVYSLDYRGKPYSWPVTGGVVNQVAPGKYELGFILFAPPGTGPLATGGLDSFIDGWAAYGEVDPRSGKVELLQMRFVNTTYASKSKSWTGFKWLPGFEDFGARSYIRMKP
jgi:hypothetical protein